MKWPFQYWVPPRVLHKQRSIQRDTEALRCFFADQHLEQSVIYDAAAGGYRLTQSTPTVLLSNSEILAVCKILLESRSMLKTEMEPILDKLIFLFGWVYPGH